MGEAAMELNKELLDCMQALRRRLRQELGVDVRLSQTDAISALLEGGLQSDDVQTRGLAQRLAQLSDSAPPTPPAPITVEAPGASLRVYRGQRIYA